MGTQGPELNLDNIIIQVPGWPVPELPELSGQLHQADAEPVDSAAIRDAGFPGFQSGAP